MSRGTRSRAAPAVLVSVAWLHGLARWHGRRLAGADAPDPVTLALVSPSPDGPASDVDVRLLADREGLEELRPAGVVVASADQEARRVLGEAGIVPRLAGVTVPLLRRVPPPDDLDTLQCWGGHAAALIRAAAGLSPAIGEVGEGGRSGTGAEEPPPLPWPMCEEADGGAGEHEGPQAVPDGPLAAPAAVLRLWPEADGADPADAPVIRRFQRLARPVPRWGAPDARRVGAALRQQFPWMGEAVRVVERELALLPPGAPAVLPPLLLVGPPGCGKTRFGGALLDACGLPWRLVGCADGGGATALGGSGRGWRGGRPCAPLQLMAEAGLGTAGLLVDDLDRAPQRGEWGTPATWLLGLLERHQAARYWCPFLLVPADLAGVSWILTANDLAPLPGALVDRCIVLEVEGPPPGMLPGIVRDMAAGILADVGWAPGAGDAPVLPHGVAEELARAIGENGGEATLRDLRRAVRAALGASRLGEDALAAGLDALANAGGRDDRAYVRSRMGFGR